MAGRIDNKPKLRKKTSDRATWVDHLKAGFQPVEKREEYLDTRVRQREEEEKRKKRMKGS